MFKFDMIVHDSFFRLTERMIVHDSFSVSGGNQGGLNAIWLPQNNNLDEYSDDSEAESEKGRKAKKAKKPDNETWSSSLICNLIDEYEARPCLWNIFCDDYHNRDVTGKAKKELEVSQSELHHVHGQMFYLFA